MHIQNFIILLSPFLLLSTLTSASPTEAGNVPATRTFTRGHSTHVPTHRPKSDKGKDESGQVVVFHSRNGASASATGVPSHDHGKKKGWKGPGTKEAGTRTRTGKVAERTGEPGRKGDGKATETVNAQGATATFPGIDPADKGVEASVLSAAVGGSGMGTGAVAGMAVAVGVTVWFV